MRIGTQAEAVLPQYIGTDVVVVSMDENDDACCICVGLSDDTFWFFGEDCVGRLPFRVVVADIVSTDTGYMIEGKNIKEYMI